MERYSKIICLLCLLLALSSITNGEIDLYGTYYQNTVISRLSEDWNYTNMNLLYLKLIKPYKRDYKLKSNISFLVEKPSFTGQETQFDMQRLNLRTSLNKFEFTLGRFLPEYQYTNFFRPINIFLGPQFLQNDLVFTGIDGFSIKRYIGMLSSAQYVAIPDSQLERSSHYLNFTSNIGTFDFSVLSHYDGTNNTKTAGIGFKGDMIFSLSHETLIEYEEYDQVRIKSATGVDYSVDQYMLMVEYLYNESSISFATKKFTALRDTNYLYANGFYFESLGKTIGISALMNLNDSSLLLSAYYQNEIFNGVTVSLGLYRPYSENRSDEFSTSKLGDIVINGYLKAKF